VAGWWREFGLAANSERLRRFLQLSSEQYYTKELGTNPEVLWRVSRTMETSLPMTTSRWQQVSNILIEGGYCLLLRLGAAHRVRVARPAPPGV